VTLIDKTFNKNMEIIRVNVSQNDFDWVHVNEGLNRQGKSTLSLFEASEVDPRFIERPLFAFNVPQAFQRVAEIEQAGETGTGRCILFDEGGESLFNRESMSKFNRLMVKLLMRIGAYNVFFIINIPDFFMLDSYIRKSRVRSLARVLVQFDETDLKFKRGFYEFYGFSTLKRAYQDQHGVAIWPRPDFRGRFPKHVNPTLWEKYLKAKKEYLSMTNRSALHDLARAQEAT
jgi:hypothetical protein